jgi:hypothetical protein
MRKINAFVESKVYADVLEYFALVEIELPDFSFYVTTLPFGVTVGSKSFVSDAGIVDYSPPDQSSSVDRETFSLSFADPTGVFKEKLMTGAASSYVRVRNGFFNVDKTPNLDVANLIIAYEGVLDETSFSSDFEESSVSLTCSSPMADLGLKKTMITSADGMDQFNVDDTSFDKVIANKTEKFKWGKV